MQQINSLITNRSIGEFKSKPIGQLEYNKVESLLSELDELITPTYKKWFAKNFYHLTEPVIRRLASEALQEGKNPAKLFCYKIKLALKAPTSEREF